METPPIRFSFKPYRRPFAIPVHTSRGVWETREGILLRMEAEDGRCGFGEIAPIEDFGTETFAGALAWCSEMKTARPSEKPLAAPSAMPCCRAALGAAMRQWGKSDADTAEGHEEKLRVAALIPNNDHATDAVRRASDAGYSVFKMKIGVSDFRGEQTLVSRLIEYLPPEGKLRLDANGGLDLRTAMRWLDFAVENPVEFIEQPLPETGARDLQQFAEDHGAVVALDESVRDADDIKRWRDRGWRGVFVIKPSIAGDWKALLEEVRIEPDAFVFSTALETGIGAAAGVSLAFEAGVSRALGYGVGAFFPDDNLGGAITVPEFSRESLAHVNMEVIWNSL